MILKINPDSMLQQKKNNKDYMETAENKNKNNSSLSKCRHSDLDSIWMYSFLVGRDNFCLLATYTKAFWIYLEYIYIMKIYTIFSFSIQCRSITYQLPKNKTGLVSDEPKFPKTPAGPPCSISGAAL